MSLRKISNKRLSRNLKTRKAPLRVLPLETYRLRHRIKQNMKKRKMEEHCTTPLPPLTVQCSVEEITRVDGKHVKKRPIIVKPFMNLRFTMNALQWILILIFLYLAAGTITVMIQDGTEMLKNIVIYSIIGFFTFFMGYLGWILARDVLEIVSEKKHIQNEANPET